MKPANEWVKLAIFQRDSTASDEELQTTINLIQANAIKHAI